MEVKKGRKLLKFASIALPQIGTARDYYEITLTVLRLKVGFGLAQRMNFDLIKEISNNLPSNQARQRIVTLLEAPIFTVASSLNIRHTTETN
jgi:hypothetical protein